MSAVNGTVASVVGLRIQALAVSEVGNAGLQRQQVGDVASFHGKLLDLNFIEGVTDRGVGRVNRGGFGTHLDGLG